MQFDVEKEAGKVKFMLEKKQVHTITAEVVVTVDLSGSTRELYASGTMQEAVQRIVPIALNFDDNGELPVYGFNDGDRISTLPAMTKNNFDGYVRREIIDNSSIHKWGGTDYAPVLKEVLADLGFLEVKTSGFLRKTTTETIVAKSKTGLPAIIYHLTDGENSDKVATAELVAACAKANAPVYFNFVGIGTGSSFSFLQQLADDYPNAEITKITDLAKVANSDEIYDHLLPEELLEWLKAYVR